MCEDILYGALKIEQPAPGTGPRVTVDSVLLADFARLKGRAKALELGCAHGAVSLMCALRAPYASVHGIDIQPELVDMANRNSERNEMQPRVWFSAGDLCALKNAPWLCGGPYDAVITNPPYEDPSRGRMSPNASLAMAVHGGCTLNDVVEAARRALKSRGRMYVIIRASRAPELLHIMRATRLEPKVIKMVHPKPGSDASMCLVQAVRDGGPGAKIRPPLHIYDSTGTYTPELLEAYRV